MPQRSDGIEELAAVSNIGDAEVLEVLRRQIGQNCLVYLILAECRLILPEAQAPQPDHNVHDGAPTIGGGAIICRGSESVQGGVWFLRASQRADVKSQWPVFNSFVKHGAGGRNPEIAG